MKNIFYTLILTTALFSCNIDDNSINNTDATDFTEDISDMTHFTMSTPIQLKINKETLIADTLMYKVLDTIKFNLSFKSKYQDNITDTYDIFESTGALEYTYGINEGWLEDGLRLGEILDLDILSKFPEAIGLSDIEIKSSPVLKDLYFKTNNIRLRYNKATETYESNFGIVIRNTIPLSSFINYIHTNIVTTNKATDKNIVINIPVIHDLGRLFIKVE